MFKKIKKFFSPSDVTAGGEQAKDSQEKGSVTGEIKTQIDAMSESEAKAALEQLTLSLQQSTDAANKLREELAQVKAEAFQQAVTGGNAPKEKSIEDILADIFIPQPKN